VPEPGRNHCAAAQALRRAVVHCRGRAESMIDGETIAMGKVMNSQPQIRHILVAHDFEETSDAALDRAIELARALSARVTVLHAFETRSMGAPEVLVLATDYIQQIRAVAKEKLDAVVARVRDARVAIEPQLIEGSAWRVIDRFAKEHQVDLIVVGSHGRRGLPRALLGSVAEKIVRTAPCPVLVVRGEADEGSR
jgi:nucleotide-binding universal stress UspA family protein